MSTDIEWERWGERDPYYGVITLPHYRAAVLTVQAKEEFFLSGQHQVTYLMDICRRHFDPAFAPQRVLDFGCGVGRVVIPFAALAAEVIGMDVSPSMLAEARRNCDERHAPHVQLVPSDDAFSAVTGSFDFVHSFIVLQHIPLERGRRLFEALVARVRPLGVGALHVTYACSAFGTPYGQLPPPPPPPPEPSVLARARMLVAPTPAPPPPPPPAADADPEMQMNFYNLSELMYLLQQAGVNRVHTELSDHGGAKGAYLFFQRPA